MTRFNRILLGLGVALQCTAANCPKGMVQSGSTCLDKYEASIYQSNDPRCMMVLKAAKRLPSNAEWQAAALGTPDPWPQNSNPQFDPAKLCTLKRPSATLTGSRRQCMSDVGAFDMVGNVVEFVADWGALATTGANWDVFIPGFGDDVSNLGGVPNGTIYSLPGTTLRGGNFAITPNSGGMGERAGVYAIDQNGAPNSIGDATAAGFRCAQ